MVGIDDWAWRQGHRYSTIVVDLERGCPIDVLEDRLADTVAAWLQVHPEVRVVARDRAGSYEAGIRQGAPEAVQVADRFHLVQNLAEALKAVFSVHHQDLAANVRLGSIRPTSAVGSPPHCPAVVRGCRGTPLAGA